MICKKDLRAFYKKQREQMSFHEKKVKDLKIFENLINCEYYKDCELVLAYVSSQIEVDTYPVIYYSLKNNKQVALPRCVPNTNLMNFYEINSFDDLQIGSFGILEPKFSCKVITDFNSRACCLVPGLAYDKRGNRLGFGKGFYDRFLQNFNGKKIGLCYSDCICDELPANDFDQKTELLVTNNSTVLVSE